MAVTRCEGIIYTGEKFWQIRRHFFRGPLLFDHSSVAADEAILYDTLFTGYNKNVRPRVNAADTVDVEIEFELHTIADLVSADEHIVRD